MKHSTAALTSLASSLTLGYIGFNLNISMTAATVSGCAVFWLFIIAVFVNKRGRAYMTARDELELEAPGEVVDEINALENKDAHRMFRLIGFLFLLALIGVMLTGCGGQVMFVEYGLNRMASYDKQKLNHILTNNPDGRRESWYNEASNSQYTITPVQTYFAPGGQDARGTSEKRLCREYLVDDVYPYNAPAERRGHMQLTEFACFDQHQDRWYAINGHAQRPWFTVGGPNYFNRRRN